MLQLVYTVWSNDKIGTSLLIVFLLPLLLLLLLLIVIYDGIGTYNEMIIMDWELVCMLMMCILSCPCLSVPTSIVTTILLKAYFFPFSVHLSSSSSWLYPSISPVKLIPCLYLIRAIRLGSNGSNANCHRSSICMKNIVIPIVIVVAVVFITFCSSSTRTPGGESDSGTTMT